LTLCKASKGENGTEYFEQFLGVGNQCYLLPENQTLPFEECREYLYAWAVGRTVRRQTTSYFALFSE